MTTTLRQSLPFLLGFGFAFLPNYGPFVGLLFFFATRWSLQRLDLVWLGAALLLALPSVSEGFSAMALGFLQILAPWLIYRAFTQLHTVRSQSMNTQAVATGLLSGLSLVVVLGWLQIDQLNFFQAKTIAQAIVWESNPSLYGHTVFLLGALIAILLPQTRLRLVGLGVSALGILVSGSREAAIAWVIVSVALLFIHFSRSYRSYLTEIGMMLAMLAIAAGLGPALGWGNVGFLVDLLPSSEQSQNLFQGSEIASGDWWDPMGVSVETASVTIAGRTLTSYNVAKTAPEPWRRLQQVVTLDPDTSYTLSVWVRQPGSALAGVQGWGEVEERQQSFTVSGRLDSDGWHAGAAGPGRLLGSGVSARDGEWQRVWVSFVYEGGVAPLYWWVGMAPDQRDGRGEAAQFAGLQLEPGSEPSAYVPGPVNRGLGLRVARIPFWQVAWQGFAERPLLGWGPGSFPDYYRDHLSDGAKLHEIPSHAHNLVLQVLFERGLVGLVGLGLLVAGIGAVALQKRDLAFLAVFAALLVANMFDYTFFYGGVLYPLAAVAGWRAVSYVPAGRDQESTSQQVVVRLALASVDLLMVGLAFLFAGVGLRALDVIDVYSVTGSTFYLFLLWPAMYWREGLYPGYGLTAPQELQKQVYGALYASVVIAASVLIVSEMLLGPVLLLATTLLSTVLVPIGRSFCKRTLYRLGFWGRQVVILGAGEVGQRVAKALLKTPLDGLHPVAFFDDDPAYTGRNVASLPVLGSLKQADAYARHHNVRHTIVALPNASSSALSKLISHKRRTFERVQFVPELAGLPAEDVYTSNLDGLLALEIRNGLYAPANRIVKRAIDVAVGSLGALLISPILLAIYVWIRLDSSGSAFYWSPRIGRRGETFYCLKFRSMHTDADERLEEMLKTDTLIREEYNRYHKLEHDPRVTRAGAFIRKYSLDELAQLYNVVTGDMSLVGPRPYMIRERSDMGSYAPAILEAKPGMTGYWQVSGRSEVSFDERLTMESHYVRNWSIWWDVVILLQTIPAVLQRKGAR